MSTSSEQRTLASRMTEGKIPVADALHYAMSLAEALRKLHDAGKAHGSLTPTSIVLAGPAVDLIPSLGPSATVTPYTAPEVLQGQPADARSDIFAFGAIVFEMLTGRRAFDGETQTELKLALSNAAPPPSGSPAVDRLVNSCMAKSPAARWQRMQKIIMELKLLTVAARRADTPVAARGATDTALRAEMQQMEARLSLRLANYEKTIGVVQAAAGEAAESLKGHLATVHAQLAAIEERPVQAPVNVDALIQQIQGHVEKTIAAVSEKLQAQVNETVDAANSQHSAHVQEAFGALRQEIAAQVRETVDAANSQHSAQAQEALGALRQEMAAQVRERVDAANSQHSAQAQEALGALKLEISSQVKETVDAANSQYSAQAQEALGALRQEIASQVKESVDAANSQHSAQAQEALGALRQEIASQVKESVDAANSEHSGQAQEAFGALKQEIAAQVKETVDAANSEHSAQAQEAFGALRQEIAAQVKETVDAANSEHSAQAQEAFGALRQEIASQVKETVDAANSQHSAQAQEAFGALRQEIAAQVKETVDAANSQQAAKLQEAFGALRQEIAAQVKETVDAANSQQAAKLQEGLSAVSAVNERMAAAERNMEEIRKHFATLQENVAGDLHDFEKTIKAQGVAIESARTAMAQTDDLVERVVEALELMQSSMIDQHEVAGVN